MPVDPAPALQAAGPAAWTIRQWIAVLVYALAFAGMAWLVYRIARPFDEEGERRP